MKTYLLLLLIIVCSLNVGAQTMIFLSPEGDDGNTGEEEHPLKTIMEAQRRIRSKKSGESIVYLRGGDYRLDRPLLFTPEDGNTDKYLTITAYPGEKPVIKGSVTILASWKPYRDGIMQTKIDSPLDIDMLLVNGEIRHMARYPDYDADAVRFNGTSADATSPERVKRWKNPQGGFLHAMHVCDWGDFHYRINGKDKKGNLDLEGGWQNNRQIGLSEENRMVENIFEELDAPGEWYYDKVKTTLYYFPMDGENLATAVLEVPVVKHLFELKGCSNVTLKGLEMTQTRRTFMEKYEPLLRSDWTVYRGGAVLMERTSNCNLERCYLHDLGGNALFFSNYNRNSGISSSHITRIGASAICFVGNTDAVRSPSFEYNDYVPIGEMDMLSGPKSDDYPECCYVFDNLIHSIGLFEKQVTGIELSMCRGITVSHNSIYDTPRAGINVSEGTWGGHIIEYNDVFDTVKETGDHGSFNSWGRDRFWHPDRLAMDSLVAEMPALILADVVEPIVIRNNRFRCDRGWDIDLDDGSSNYHIYNNLCLNGGIKLREGFYRNVENNILINNTFHPHVWFHNSGDVFVRNIVMTPYQPINIDEWGREVDYNIFTDSVAWRDARLRNTDANSIICKVRFVNPEQGDFTLVENQPEIFRQGFRNFDMSSFGVVSAHLKLFALQPAMPQISDTSDSEISEVIEWRGWRLKTLSTLGEQSATGMDSLHGIYVINDNPDNHHLQANDVILQVGDKVVNTVDDFMEAIAKVSGSIAFTIQRNQKKEIRSLSL